MKKVFAVIIFLFLFIGCNRIQSIHERKPKIETKNSHIIYSNKTDIDGDKKNELIYITKSSTLNPILNLKDDGKIYSQELNINIDNYYTLITDINIDGKLDFIIYSVDNGSERMYAYFFSPEISPLISQESIDSSLNFTRTTDGYSITAGELKKTIKSANDLQLKFCSYNIEYIDNIPLISRESAISTDGGRIISLVTTVFKITPEGNININDLRVSPYIEAQ